MSIEPYARLVRTKDDAHQAVKDAYVVAQIGLQDGRAMWIEARVDEDPLSIRQRKFLHGPVLNQISEQVRVEGVRYTTDIWKEHLRKVILEATPKYEMRRAPRFDTTLGRLVPAKKATPHRIRRSTEDLTVKGYSEYLDKVLAYAATEWSVEFHFDIDQREGARYRPPARKLPVLTHEVQGEPA